jgi:arylsulfatase A-like enzyme
MTRLWLYRILRGTLASFLVGAVLGGVETMLVLRGPVTEMVNALERLQLWGLNVLLCGGLAALIGLLLSAAVGSAAGHTPEIQSLALETQRDPRHPWLPWVIGGALGGTTVLQVLPWATSTRAGGAGRAALALGLVVVAAAAVAVGLRIFLRRVDHTGRGGGLAVLGLPAALVATMSLTVSTPMAGGKGEATRAREGVPNVLLITVDGLRADHVGTRARVRTDALGWLGRKGVSFDQVIAGSTADGPGLATMLTGRHALSTGFLVDGQSLPARVPGSNKPMDTLATVLRKEGYATGAFVSSAALDGRATGLNRGFDVYDDGVGSRRRGWRRLALPTLLRWARYGGLGTPEGSEILRPGAETLIRFEHWLAYHYRQNFFAWVHIADPRMPFLYAEQRPADLYDPLPGDAGRAYGARVALLDVVLGELFEALEEDGLLDWTLVVVAGSRGYVPGGQPTIDEPWIHVPLILYGPGLEGGGTVHAQVRAQDLTPTILSAAGFRRARLGDGVSMVPLLEGREMEPLEALSVAPPRADGRSATSLRTPEWKYTRDAKGSHSYYLLESDPKEHRDRSEEYADRVEDIGGRLTDLLGREVPRVDAPSLGAVRGAELRGLDVHR